MEEILLRKDHRRAVNGYKKLYHGKRSNKVSTDQEVPNACDAYMNTLPIAGIGGSTYLKSY